MLYVLDLEVRHTNKVISTWDVEISGSIQTLSGSTNYINVSNQTRIVDATNEAEARQKVQTYYTNQNTEFDIYNATILSITDTIV